jgi:hypothetical protein
VRRGFSIRTISETGQRYSLGGVTSGSSAGVTRPTRTAHTEAEQRTCLLSTREQTIEREQNERDVLDAVGHSLQVSPRVVSDHVAVKYKVEKCTTKQVYCFSLKKLKNNKHCCVSLSYS